MPILWGDAYWSATKQAPAVDPLNVIIGEGHTVALDLLMLVRHAQTVTRALELQQEIKTLVQTLERIELVALERADDLNR